MANRMNQPIDSPQELIEAFEVNSFSLSYETTCPFTDKVEVYYFWYVEVFNRLIHFFLSIYKYSLMWKYLIKNLHLKIFDDEKRGYITMEEFRSVMTTLGEKLSHSDVDEMVTMTGIGKNGKVKYKGMIQFN